MTDQNINPDECVVNRSDLRAALNYIEWRRPLDTLTIARLRAALKTATAPDERPSKETKGDE